MQFIGDNIRKFRSEINITREELAQKIKKNGNSRKSITARTIVNWETGESRPDADSLAKMCQFFQKDLILFFTPVAYQQGLVSRKGHPKADR